MSLADKIKANEGFSERIYKDSRGFDTIGYGFLVFALTTDELALNSGQIEPMSREIADKILDFKLAKLERAADAAFSWLSSKPPHVREVVLEMTYQLGLEKLKSFTTTLGLIQSGDYENARKNALKSLWAKQTPNRAKKVLNGLFA